MFNGIKEDFEATKSIIEFDKPRVAQFKASPKTTAKFNKVYADMKQIMVSGGPEGGQVDDATVKKWIGEAQAVHGEVEYLYNTYIVQPKPSGTGATALPAALTGETIMGIPRSIFVGLAALAVLGGVYYATRPTMTKTAVTS